MFGPAMNVVKQILLGSVVGGVTMTILLILLPNLPVFMALAMAAGSVAGNLTWRPAHVPWPKFITGCTAIGTILFTILYAVSDLWA